MIVNADNLNFVDGDEDFELLIERLSQMHGRREYLNRGE